MNLPTQRLARIAGTVLLVLLACHKKEVAPLYEEVSVERRTIQVSASASGVIEPVRAIDIKSKASGEIIGLPVDIGDEVRESQLMASIDPRVPRNTLSQAEADLEVANATLKNTTLKLARADTLVAQQAITQEAHDDARLAYVQASAQVVRAKAALETARDAMNDTKLRAPVTGTIIAKNVELGTVISSPTKDVGGGTVLMRMANLDTVQIRTLVDETDIGKVRPGMEAVITVDAYPNRPFMGQVLKIEPQATVQQNVTMFPALVRIANPGHLLMPGMNAEVVIQIGTRENVLAIPYAALRTPRDVASAALVLNLDPQEVQAELAGGTATKGGGGGGAPDGGGAPGVGNASAATDSSAAKADTSKTKRVGGPYQHGGTRPPGAGAPGGGQWRGAQGSNGWSGGGGMRGAMGGGGMGGMRSRGMGGRYIVFTLRDGKPVPVNIKTGLTDLDYVEVLDGLKEGDKVIMLPSASLVNSQKEMRDRMQRITGGGGIPGMKTQQQQGSGPTPVQK
jgi:HlyD family secretion protein